MKDKIIYIDDEEAVRYIYQDVLEDVYGDEYEVITLEPSDTLLDMVSDIQEIDKIVSIVVDEKLQIVKGVDYSGADLVEALRAVDCDIPIYILTSDVSLLAPILGSVEYVIDKKLISQDEPKNQFSELMRRHIDSFNRIKSSKAARFDELLKKSIEHGLSQDENDEYEALNFVRVKKVLANEEHSNNEELDKQDELLAEIEKKLKEIGGN